MSRFEYKESNLGKFKTFILQDNESGTRLETAFKGATPLSFNMLINGREFNILDGFASEEELDYSRGARNWIMTPFANRIKDGRYRFEGNEYVLEPIAPRDYVIHGYTSHELFELEAVEISDTNITALLVNRSIRNGKYPGYPFSADVYVKFTLSGSKVNISVEGRNTGEESLPFFSGWHPYFKTSARGIEHLILTLDAGSNIVMDPNYLPLEGRDAYAPITDFPGINYSPSVPISGRRINGRVIDNCFAGLNFDSGGTARSLLYDPDNGVEITVFQKGGVTLVFTGDSLKERKRESVAIEPMQSITNTFNRPELKELYTVQPGGSNIFEFGFEVNQK